MPVRQTGNWGEAPPSAVGVDLLDVPLNPNPTTNFAMLGGGALWNATYAWWGLVGGTGVSNAFRDVPGVTGGGLARVLDGPAAENIFAGHRFEMVSLASEQKAVFGGNVVPSVRARLDLVLQVVMRGGLGPNGIEIGIEQGTDNSAFSNNSYIFARISQAGLYSQTVRNQRGVGAVTLPVAGAIDATVPHMFSVEIVNGPVNSLKLFAAGVEIYKDVRSGPLFDIFGNDITPTRGPQITIKRRDVPALPALPAATIHSPMRIRYDYV